MINLSYDESNGIVQTIVSAASDRSAIETYLMELEVLKERARSNWGRYCHLVDARNLHLQNEEALNSLAGSSIEQLDPDDRTAVVMTSPDAIAQLGRMPSQFMTRVFPNMESARNWVLHGDC